MSYKVYSGNFLVGHGYPVLIVTSPIVQGDKYICECHSFFSGDLSTYSLSECSYDAEDKDSIDEDVIMGAVKDNGEINIHNKLSEVSPIQCQAMLACWLWLWGFRERK